LVLGTLLRTPETAAPAPTAPRPSRSRSEGLGTHLKACPRPRYLLCTNWSPRENRPAFPINFRPAENRVPFPSAPVASNLCRSGRNRLLPAHTHVSDQS